MMKQSSTYETAFQTISKAKNTHIEIIKSIILYIRDFLKQVKEFKQVRSTLEEKLPERITKTTLFNDSFSKYEFSNITPHLSSTFSSFCEGFAFSPSVFSDFCSFLEENLVSELERIASGYNENMKASEGIISSLLETASNSLNSYKSSYSAYQNLCNDICSLESQNQGSSSSPKSIERLDNMKNTYRKTRSNVISLLEQHDHDTFSLCNVFDGFLYNVYITDHERFELLLCLFKSYISILDQFLTTHKDNINKLMLSISNIDCRSDIDCCFPEDFSINESSISVNSPKVELSFSIDEYFDFGIILESYIETYSKGNKSLYGFDLPGIFKYDNGKHCFHLLGYDFDGEYILCVDIFEDFHRLLIEDVKHLDS